MSGGIDAAAVGDEVWAALGKVQQAMEASWHQLRREVVDEALRRAKEAWGSQHAAIETLREQQQAISRQLRTLQELLVDDGEAFFPK